MSCVIHPKDFHPLKGFINRLQNFWKLHIFWNLFHKPWHNNILKIIKKFEESFEDFLQNILKNILPKIVPKVGGCDSCYLVFTHFDIMPFNEKMTQW